MSVGGGKKVSLREEGSMREDPAIDEFRAAVRELARENKKNVPDMINGIFTARCKTRGAESGSKEGSVKYLTLEIFIGGCNTEEKLRKKRADLTEVFEACNISGDGEVTLPALVEFTSKIPGNAKMIAAKYRKAILKDYSSREKMEIYFSQMLKDPKKDKFADKDKFHLCIEELLKSHVKLTEFLVIYDLFDQDGDDKVSLEDFLDFVMEQSPDVRAILSSRPPNAIVDLKVSVTRDMDQGIKTSIQYYFLIMAICSTSAKYLFYLFHFKSPTNLLPLTAELKDQSYEQVVVDGHASFKTASTESLAFGTFGRGQSLFCWRRKNGTCAGRLKPIVAIRLEPTHTSSALVLDGFTCLTTPISGQYIWIKRAASEEEEEDAIVDVRSTVGKMKDTSDKIHQSPGPGWFKVEGANFGKSRFGQSIIFSQNDAFLWYLPSKTGSRKYTTARRNPQVALYH